MNIYMAKPFQRWAKSMRLNRAELINTISEIEAGLYDARLGNGLFKKRIARSGQGKRQGFRTIIVYKANSRAIYLYGFSKNEKDNISPTESIAYRRLAGYFLAISTSEIEKLLQLGELKEIHDEKK